MNTVLEMLRAANVALLSAAFLCLVIFLSDTWSGLSWGRRLSMASIRLLVVAGVAGSAIKYATSAPVDASIGIVTVAALGVIAGQWLARNDTAGHIRSSVLLQAIDTADSAKYGDPCEHPGCIAARIKLRGLMGVEST